MAPKNNNPTEDRFLEILTEDDLESGWRVPKKREAHKPIVPTGKTKTLSPEQASRSLKLRKPNNHKDKGEKDELNNQ
jgi:hypothetical protein